MDVSPTKLVLYMDIFWISPYVFSCYVALKEKGLSFEVRELALQNKEQKSEEYQKNTVTGKVPSLQNGSFYVSESNAIAEYLEDIFPAPNHPRLFPENAEKRARARQVMGWIRSDLLPIRDERSTYTMFYEELRAKKPLSESAQVHAKKLNQVAERLIPQDGGNLFGEWSLADADLAFMLHRLIINGDEINDRVKTWAQKQFERPSIREFLEHKRAPYVEYYS